MDQMDIDQPSSSSKRPAASPPAASSSKKRAKNLLTEAEETTLNNAMRRCLYMVTGDSLTAADDSQWSALLSRVLTNLVGALQSTSLKANFIAIPTFAEAPKMVDKFSEEELEEWKSGVRNGVENNNWYSLITHHRILAPSPSAAIEVSENETIARTATLGSWTGAFVGNSAEIDIGCYARYFAHVQSSGTGESRVHDELAKSILYIPICLALESAHAYPPPDTKVRQWLCAIVENRRALQERCNALLHALLIQTQKALTTISKDLSADLEGCGPQERLSKLSSKFRDKMAEGRSFEKHGPYRSTFYDKVIEQADQNLKALVSTEPPSGFASPTYNLIEATADEIVKILDPDCGVDGLLVVICWDEAHSLTEEVKLGESWSCFSELRRSLHKIRNLPFFSVFLSTAGNFHLFSPDAQIGTSHRISTFDLSLFSPITEVGFDEFAIKVDSTSTTLAEVASTNHMAHLGRSLFPTRYDYGDEHVKSTIIGFAQEKLLCRNLGGTPLKEAEKLACLAVRLGLDFRATSWSERQAEREQVERHMRLCLAATTGFHNMVTISPSEPLLAEAAYMTMAGSAFKNDVAHALLSHIDSSYLNAGDRGEVIAALLLLLARDKVIANKRSKPFPADKPSSPPNNLEDDGGRSGRIVTILELLYALIPTDAGVDVKNWKPFRATANDQGKTLKDTFASAHVWFNHFIKVHDFDVVNQQYLWRIISRGAALICANNHRGIDIVIPILFGIYLKPERVSAIFIQVKNDRSYTANVRQALFTGMDPFKVGLFSKGEKKVLPIIRMVFALASNVSAVKIKEAPPPPEISTRSATQKKGDRFTAHDIWVAGATHKSFGVISENDNNTYSSLLQRSCKIFHGYDLIDRAARPSDVQQTKRAEARRTMHPGVATKSEHFVKYVSSAELAQDISVELDDEDSDL